MILQAACTLHPSASLSFSSRPLNRPFTLILRPQRPPATLTVTCSISKIHSYGTVDYEKKPVVKWTAVYTKISFMAKNDPRLGSATILNDWENQGKMLTKWELCKIVKELRKFNRFKQALEVYDWMNNRGERFRLTTSDAAIQLDLIAKVRGLPSAEDFFHRLPNNLKDNRIYGALLNSYVRARMREKAESMMSLMKDKGYATSPLPYNVMMTLYMKLKEYDKVEPLISEMMEKNIRLDIYSYNIWLSSRGYKDSAEGMEQILEQLKVDKTIYPNWTTFSTMASMYIRMGLFEKAEASLRNVESRITGRDREPYHYLFSLYGSIGKKDEVHRVWNTYKSVFPTIPNLGYHSVMASLIKVGDVDGAEKIYEEWLSGKTYYDPRLANLLISVYVEDGNMEKAKSFFTHMVEEGGKPTSSTWEILAQVHIRERRIDDALSCLKEAYSTEGSNSWRLKPANMSAFSNLCEEEGDAESKGVLVELLRQSGHLKDEVYASFMGFSSNMAEKEGIDYDNDREEDGSEILFDQIAD